MQIATFDDLVQAARGQPVPQRLLFVFAKAVLPKGADEEERRRFQSKAGGSLQPLMSVDKRPEDLASFAALAAEADAMSSEWQIVFVAALAGKGAIGPNAADADRNLQLMIDTIEAGGDVSRYLAFDRGGELLSISQG